MNVRNWKEKLEKQEGGIIEGSTDHCGKGKQSHQLRHALNSDRKTVVMKN